MSAIKGKKNLSDFFEALSKEEFESMCIECGIDIIEPSEESNPVKYIVEGTPTKYTNYGTNYQNQYSDMNTFYIEDGQGAA